MSRFLDREPVATLAVVQTVIALAVSFGLELTPEQVGAILAATAAVLGWITRTKVTPTGWPKADDGTPLVPATRTSGAMTSRHDESGHVDVGTALVAVLVVLVLIVVVTRL